ncbi:MAG TPA: glycosyltransferase family 39 protein [Candidatus Binatia bacterium]
MPLRSEPALHLLLLVALCSVLYFPYLGSTPFFDKGEPREALAVQDIVQRGEWLVPLKRATDIPSKPPLLHWSAALVTKMTGSLNEVTIRFPSTFYAILGVLLVYWLGRKMFDGPTALLGGAILATSMIYQDQALNARVDMTLCFFVTAGLVLFYGIYRGYLENPLWLYVFYTVVGVGTLAKGPLSVVLTALVAGSFVLVERRWDMIRRFCFHPGVVLMLILATGWYVVAVIRGGEGFFDRQIVEENLSRFVGDAGHNHPVYYYAPYLFSQGMPWALFFPLLLWDVFRTGLRADDGRLYLKLWVLVMFVFLSISVGKRPVYLLPLYPALALLLAAWFYKADAGGNVRTIGYKAIACFTMLIGALLLIITTGALWNQDQGWFFAPIEALLKPKDRANAAALRNQLDDFGWTFTLVALIEAGLWFSLARSLWLGKMRTVAHQLLLVSFFNAFLGWKVVMPAIAQSKSYRDFMAKVNEIVKPNDKLFLYGPFNSDSVVFYRGSVIEWLNQPAELVAWKDSSANGYLIMPVQSLTDFPRAAGSLPPPLLESAGKGPEGDAPLVLVRAALR